jgi:hypothetical protein
LTAGKRFGDQESYKQYQNALQDNALRSTTHSKQMVHPKFQPFR